METEVNFFARKLAKNQRKMVCFLFLRLNASLIKLLVAQRHVYMGKINHICGCGEWKNEFDIILC